MNVRHLVAAAAASALLGGAAYAQQPGETPNQPAPADPTDSRTGLPSVDSTRPTGADAGATNLPHGQVHGDASAEGEATAGATSAGGAATGASATTQLVANAPIPDTPENRAKYGQPLSGAGKRTAPAGN